ncbi:hypothetical protein UY3_07159 [Chelonia mydas]|uniref:Uncharacterized protein n=1 Tax=Chelonia mydas TaxID=8469 RepID=M7BUA5_CHEMY|nr:hypothetical protein UY3_07159 [Chelonia mydas]
MEEDFGAEEEEEETVQQAIGESVLPCSQDLFIILEPIPSPTLKLEKASLRLLQSNGNVKEHKLQGRFMQGHKEEKRRSLALVSSVCSCLNFCQPYKLLLRKVTPNIGEWVLLHPDPSFAEKRSPAAMEKGIRFVQEANNLPPAPSGKPLNCTHRVICNK